MAVDPHGIRLSEADLAVLNTLAAESGKEFSTALPVDVYLQRSSEANGQHESVQGRKEAFRRAAGAWKDMDTDTMLEEMYALRLRPSRPAPEL